MKKRVSNHKSVNWCLADLAPSKINYSLKGQVALSLHNIKIDDNKAREKLQIIVNRVTKPTKMFGIKWTKYR